MFWSESVDVLCWLCNVTRRFKPFVANRVAEIQDSSSSKQWKHVQRKENPADLATGGVTGTELARSEIWWQGPKFLREVD